MSTPTLSSPLLLLSLSFTLYLFPFIFAICFLKWPTRTPLASQLHPLQPQLQRQPATPLLFLSVAALALGGVCGCVDVAHLHGQARIAGGVFEVLAAFFVNTYLFFQIAALQHQRQGNLVKIILVLLGVLLISSIAIHVVLVALAPTTRVFSSLHGLFSIFFETTLFTLFLRDVLSSESSLVIPLSDQYQQTPAPPSSDMRAYNRFSNPWRPPSPVQRQGGDQTQMWATRIRHRSFRLAMASAVSIILFIITVILPPMHDYGVGNRVVPTFLGTTPLPAAFLVTAFGVVIRFLLVALDLVPNLSDPSLPHRHLSSNLNLSSQAGSPPSSPSKRPQEKPVAVEMRPLQLDPTSKTGTPTTRSTRVSSSNTSFRHRRTTAPPHFPFPVISDSSGTVTRTGSTASRTQNLGPRFQAQRQEEEDDQEEDEGRFSNSELAPSSLFGTSRFSSTSSSPPRISTPPILLQGLGLSLGFSSTVTTPTGATFGESPPSSPTGNKSSTSSWGKLGGRVRPSLSALQLSVEEERSHTGTFTPPSVSSISASPTKTSSRGFKSGSMSNIEIDVEDGDPFARDASVEAREVWMRSLRERMEVTELEVGEREEYDGGDDDGGLDKSERFDEIKEEEEPAEEERPSLGGRRQDPKTPSPVSSMHVRVTAPTPTSSLDTPPRPTHSRQQYYTQAPSYQSNIIDPFPAPSVTVSSMMPSSIPFPPSRPIYPRAHQSAPPATTAFTTPRASVPSSPSSSLATFALNRIRRARPGHGSRDSSASDESFSCKGDRDRGENGSGGMIVGPSWSGAMQQEVLMEGEEEERASIGERRASRTETRASSSTSSHSPPLSTPPTIISSGLKPLRLPELVESQVGIGERSTSATGTVENQAAKKKEKWSWWPLASPTSPSTSFLPRTSSPIVPSAIIRRTSSTPVFRHQSAFVPPRAPSQLAKYPADEDPYAIYDSPGTPSLLSFTPDSTLRGFRSRYRTSAAPIGELGGMPSDRKRHYESTPPLSAMSNYSVSDTAAGKREGDEQNEFHEAYRDVNMKEGEGKGNVFSDEAFDDVLTWDSPPNFPSSPSTSSFGFGNHPRETTVSSSNSGFSALRSSISVRGGRREGATSSYYARERRSGTDELEASTSPSSDVRRSEDSGLSMARLIARDAHSFGIAATPPSSSPYDTSFFAQAQAKYLTRSESDKTAIRTHPIPGAFEASSIPHSLSPLSPSSDGGDTTFMSTSSASPSSAIFDSPLGGEFTHYQWGWMSDPDTPDSKFFAEEQQETDSGKE